MSFVVQCPYCKGRARVPDYAKEGSGKCSRCASFFTLTPVEDHDETAAKGATVTAEPLSLPAPTSTEDQAAAQAPSDAFDDTASEILELPTAPKTWRPQDALLAATALLISGGGLICASMPSFCGLVKPLAGMGLGVGMTAGILALQTKQPRLRMLFPCASSSVAIALLMIAWLVPGLLGPNYLRFCQSAPAIPTSLRAVPRAEVPALKDPPGGVNAKEYVLQRDNCQVQIVSVSLAPMPELDGTKGDMSKEKMLLIHVRVQKTLAASKTKKDNQLLAWDTSHPALLTMSTGAPCVLRASLPVTSVGSKRRADLFPVQTGDCVFSFEPPVAGWSSLSLEIPAAGWGDVGVYRFTIPVSMLNSAPTGSASVTTTRP
jgi:hypothetical protein